MIGYVTLGIADMGAAQAFYGPLLAALGASPLWADERFTFYGRDIATPMLGICTPHDGAAPSVGNGTMVAFGAPDRATVDRIHAEALSLGATDEGAPGLREPEEMQFYGAYFRAPDGHKFCIYRIGADS